MINGNLLGLAGKAAEAYKKAEKDESDLFRNLSNFAEDIMGNPSGEDDDEEKTTVTEYVDYGIDINNNGEVDDWRIFYEGGADDGDANGRIFLIAADYVPSNCSELSTALSSSGMKHCTDAGYETYYWVPAPDYECNDGQNTTLNASKGQCSFPRLFMSTGYYCSSHVGDDGKSGNQNARCASSLLCTENWSSFKKIEYADYAIGGPTLEMWVKSWNQKHGASSSDSQKQEVYIKGEEGTTGAYGYCYDTEENLTKADVADLSSSTGYDDTLYFPHKDNKNLELDGTGDSKKICFGYWLASPSARFDYYMCIVGYDGILSNNGYNNAGYRCASASLSKVWS